jgi:OmpA-OmpF porin, OOP family
VVITSTEIQLPEPIVFALDSDRILAESFGTLSQIVRIMADHPDIRMLSIEGHTSDEGSERHNLDLSRRRARAVVRWLREHGVDNRRLASEGYGMTRPIAPNDSDESRVRNRRVEFRIADRAPEQEGGLP